MANLTTEQANDLVEGGTCICRDTDGNYTWHLFRGDLDGDSYESNSVTDALGLTGSSTVAEAKAAFKTYFETQEYKGTAPVITDTNVW